jgi:hypothetical protein
MEKQILLVASNRMKENKKEDRHESVLLRMSEKVRTALKLTQKQQLLVYSDKNDLNLTIFKAYSEDIKKAKQYAKFINKIAFVHPDTIYKLTGTNTEAIEVTLSDSFKDILIGTDPELLLYDDENNIVSAAIIPHLNKTSSFGSDGAMAELRPEPAFTPEDLVQHIKTIFHSNLDKPVAKYNWISACYIDAVNRDYPVGTHLHFDNPAQIKNLDLEERMRLFAVTNKIIDELLTIPMIRLDGQDGFRRRAKCKMSVAGGFGNQYGKGYGYFGEWRVCNGRLEHRSLSGLVISSPNIAEAVFGTSKAIVEAVYKKVLDKDAEYILPAKFNKDELYLNKFNSWDKIPLTAEFNCIKSSDFMHNTMNKSSRVDINKKYINRWLSKIRKLPTYGKYEKYVESLGDVLNCSAQTLRNLNKNIKQTWGI